MSHGSSSQAAKRLANELRSQKQELAPYLESLGPVSDDQLLRWRAVLKGVPGTAYDTGLWQLDIEIPEQYPLVAPKIHFMTRIVHPNVDFRTGEICLDLLKDRWTPTYTIAATLGAVHHLLAYPAVDSPLNLEIANLLREGDEVGAEGLVRYICRAERYEGK